MLSSAVCRPRQTFTLSGYGEEEAIEVMAKVLETLPNAMFRVKWKKASTRCLRTYWEKCASILFAYFQGRVLIELSPYDLSRGRITYRYK